MIESEQADYEQFDHRSLPRKGLDKLLKRKRYFARKVFLDGTTLPHKSFPKNVVRNQKYSFIFFLPQVLWEQFKYFFNLYFLIVALSQFFPPLQVGYLFTYVAPLVFVLSITITKEAIDDLKRWRRDVKANSQRYTRLTVDGSERVPSSKISVGDLIVIEADERVPADCILMRTTEKSGASFIRTDQLDGETDWKLRRAVKLTQELPSNHSLFDIHAAVFAERPHKAIYDFIGKLTKYDAAGQDVEHIESLSLEQTLWANTVVASGTVVGLVIYTGKETRAVLNASSPRSKMGKLDQELNNLSKILFALMFLLSLLLVACKKFQGSWLITLFRFTLLFSSIIPISMRVNLDMGKTAYSFFIMRDKKIPGTVVRNSSIPEELGRIDYLFSDKTGTLTQNDMIFRKLNLGSSYFELTEHDESTLKELREITEEAFAQEEGQIDTATKHIRDMLLSLALCHNVTPSSSSADDAVKEYQASSPDEIALVKFAESVGLVLEDRTMNNITLKTPQGNLLVFDVLIMFPFTSESKRMGIVVRERDHPENIFYFIKGADTMMSKLVKPSDWLDEECDNLAREGLRTLVFGSKRMSTEIFEEFKMEYETAKSKVVDRSQHIEETRLRWEKGLDLLGVTGVEDKLQEDVQGSLENLKNAGIKLWMLTGDKVETGICIARSARLISRNQPMYKLIVDDETQLLEQLTEYAGQNDDYLALVIDGNTLNMCIQKPFQKLFMKEVVKSACVVCCRCSPTQKAQIVKLVKKYTKKQTAAIGDGGNDVNMINSADVGLGIVGKEGKQASMASDFSITQFKHCTRLILWHGRNSYKRSARLSQFIFHRGVIISIIQAVFSAIYFFAAIPVFTGMLLVGYSTFYTMIPVFSLILDEDVKDDIVFTYPELYKDLQKGRALNFRTFMTWIWKAVFQGGIMMLLAIALFEQKIIRIQSITFSALIMTELLMVCLEVSRFKIWMLLSVVLSMVIYIASIFLLPEYFDFTFVFSFDFWWKTVVLVLACNIPIYFFSFIIKTLNPPNWKKLTRGNHGPMKERIMRWIRGRL